MFKLLRKIFIGTGKKNSGLLKNPFVYFGIACFLLFGFICFSCDSQSASELGNGRFVFFNNFFTKSNEALADTLFNSPNSRVALETPDLKIIQENTLGGVATPSIVSGKVLGDIFGSSNQNKKEVIDYYVQPGDTIQSIAEAYNISVNTILWANDLTASSTLKVGQSLVILPVDGIIHVVKSGDTISGIGQTYKTQSQDIITFNDLANQDDIYIGDILVIPGGVMPKKVAPVKNQQAPLADSYFIFPTQGVVTQGVHFYNAVDVANSCGTPIYAAAAGTIQRVHYDAYGKVGNYITILHSSGVVTYYGHVMTIFVAPGQKVNVGDRIALMGGKPGMIGAGTSTGCHLHFDVIGAKNPLRVYNLRAAIKY